jgi:hypothetical protein
VEKQRCSRSKCIRTICRAQYPVSVPPSLSDHTSPRRLTTSRPGVAPLQIRCPQGTRCISLINS